MNLNPPSGLFHLAGFDGVHQFTSSRLPKGRVIGEVSMRPVYMRQTLIMMLIPLVGLMLIAHPADGQQPKETKGILLLVSGLVTMPGYRMAVEGIQAAFSKSDEFRCQYFIEHMDSLRFNDANYHQILIDSYKLKYSNRKIDLIIAIGPSATAFWASYGEDILGRLPLVVCFALKEQLKTKNHDQKITGSILEIDYQGLLDLALMNHPKTKHVAIVIGNSRDGQWIEKQIRISYATYVEKYNISFFSGLKMSDLLDRLAALPEESIIIYYFVAIDGDGEDYEPYKVASMISEVATVPTYGFSETYIGRGVVGGRVVSFTEHGKRAGEIGLRILKGENPANILSSSEGTNLTMFDWRQLKRWGIDESKLPEGSAILFKDFSFWKSYRWFIIGSFIIFICLGTLVVALSFRRKQLKKMVQKLGDSEMRYRMFLDHSLEGIWCVEFDEPIDLSLPEEEQFELVYKHGYMAEANDAYARHVGLEHGEELVGRRIEEFLSRSDPTNIATVKAWIRERYTIKNVETVERYKEAVTRIILNNAVGIIESGHVERVWGTEIDITERKQAEKALLQSKNFNTAILNTIEDHIVVTDRKGCILTVNDSWLRFARENDADMRRIGPGMHYLDVCRQAIRGFPQTKAEQKNVNEALKGLNAVLNGDANRFILEYPCHSPTEKRWFQMVVLPFTGEKGGLVVAHSDITAVKISEQKLLNAERKYRTVADFTYDWEYWEAPDGSLIYVSPACERITGYSVSELLARPNLISELVTPEDRSIWQNHGHGLQTGSKAGPSHCHFRIRNRDNSIRWIAHVCQSVYNEQGDYAGVRASNRDITKLRMAEQKLHEHREILAQVDRRETLGLLAGAIAHELNQPLTGILSDAQAGELLLEQEAADSVQIRDILTDIVTDTKRASQIIRNLRKLFTGRHGAFSPFQVNEVIGETLKILNSEIIDRGLIVQMELYENLPMVNGDSVQVQQVLINLVKNAWEAMQQNEGVDRWIKVNTASENDGHVVICVEDNGPGIDQDQINSIFKPLKSEKKGGLGMGLAICQSIVKTHGGRLWVEKRANGGTRFSFTLPILEVIS